MSLMGNAAAVDQMQTSQAQGSANQQAPRTLNDWASESLSSRFSIVEPGAQRQAGNQVTQREFDQIAATFADIYAGKSDIEFDLESLPEDQRQAFKMGAMTDLANILQTASGRDLIQSLHDAPGRGFLGLGDRKTTIRQNGGANADPSNAFGGGEPGKWGTVAYVPGQNHGPDRNLRSDVTLYHELVHAHHAVYNTWDYDGVAAERGGTRDDIAGQVGEHEHQAVGLGEHVQDRFSENRYRQERRAIGASNVGERRGDDNMAHRDRYLGFDG